MKLSCCFLMYAGIVSASWSQPGKVIELRSANELKVRSVNGEEVRDFIGNVHFVQPSATGGTIRLWCQRALQYTAQGKIDLFGNVRIVRDSVTLKANEGTYYNTTRRAKMMNGVQLERGGTILTAKQGDYQTDEKRAHFSGNVVIVDSASTTTCDELTYFETDDKSIAVGHVTVVSPSDGVTVFGDSLVNLGRINYTVVPKHPRLVQVDTSETGVPDTLLVVSKTMEAYKDISNRFIARESVQIVRNELAARCGEATYRPQEGLIILLGQPVVWYGENQVTGDSIAVRVENRRLRSVYVRGRAMAASRSDSLLAERFDQLTGRELMLYFGKTNVERIEATRNATSLYYLFDNSLPNGVNKSSGDRIIIEFADGLVDRIRVIGGVEGQYYPEEMIGQRERSYNLDGFKWYQNRPRRNVTEMVTD